MIISPERFAEIRVYLEQVSRGTKPAADLGVWSAEEMDQILEEILSMTVLYDLRVYIEEFVDNNGPSFTVYVFKYHWVEDLLDFMIKKLPADDSENVAFHILSGLLYGYSADSIEDFVKKERLKDRCRKIVRKATTDEPEDE